MTKFTPPELTEEEKHIIQETRRTGNLNIFSSYFFQLPKSGTRWMDGDAIGHYRRLFQYEQLYDAWSQAGKPDHAFDVAANEYPYHIDVDWVGNKAEFLLRHGFLFPAWIEPVVAQDTDVALVITGTGSGKTAGAAISSLAYCLMYPGFEYMNIAPSEKQAQLILSELDKWAGGSRFRDFIKITSRHELYIKKPYALCTIISPLDPRYPSHFACQTIGEKSADQILGESKDRFSIDECQLVDDLQAIIPKVVTRSRAQRADGSSRWTSLLMMTNPPDDPSRMANIDLARKKIERIQANPTEYGAEIKAIFLENIASSENLYVTKKQTAYHLSMLDTADQARWLHGSTVEIGFTGDLPARLITDNIDPVMDDEINHQKEKQKRYHVVARSGMGVIQYEMPRQENHIYLVVGDPGENNAIKIDYNNVPVVMVFDITDFLVNPNKLVFYAMLDGMGTLRPWLDCFRYAMLKYRSPGYYDATNNPGFEESRAFSDEALEFEYQDKKYKAPALFVTTPITLAANNKRLARTLFTLLAQDGQFAWPHLDTLIHQAKKYAESGAGVKKLPDDSIACLFVFCMALRIEGSLWDKVVDRYYRKELDEEESRGDTDFPVAEVKTSHSRIRRHGGRNRRR